MGVVSVSVDAHVAHVVLNRPEKHNAVSGGMFAELDEAGRQLAADPAVRAVILSGAGKNFCAGIDVSLFANGADFDIAGNMAPVADSPANLFQRAAYVWRDSPVPVICAISGVAFGAGLQIALGADIRYASKDARLSIMEIKWGLIPDMAISTTARHVVPRDRVAEMSYTGKIVTADEALAMGLVTAIHNDPLAAAEATATEIANRSPSAIRAMKTLFREGWSGPEADSLALEARLQGQLIGGPDQREAVQSNLENRTPAFND